MAGAPRHDDQVPFRRGRRLPPILAVAAVVVALAIAWTGVASAHGPVGNMTVTDLTAVDASTVHVEVGIVYQNDNEMAEEATVTATLTGPGGQTVGPVPLPRLEGSLYGADVTVPAAGTWEVAVTSTDPAATASGTVEVTAAATTTTEPSTTTEATFVTQGVVEDADGDDGGSSVLPWVIVGVIVVVVVGGGAAVALTRR